MATSVSVVNALCHHRLLARYYAVVCLPGLHIIARMRRSRCVAVGDSKAVRRIPCFFGLELCTLEEPRGLSFLYHFGLFQKETRKKVTSSGGPRKQKAHPYHRAASCALLCFALLCSAALRRSWRRPRGLVGVNDVVKTACRSVSSDGCYLEPS